MVAAVSSGNWSVAEMMSELDSPSNIPEGLDLSQWERFIVTRHVKVESERQVREREGGRESERQVRERERGRETKLGSRE